MATAQTENRLVLTGEVVEILETEGGRIAKVTLKSCHIVVPIDAIPDVHLGDTAVLEANIVVQKVRALPHQ